MKIRKLPSDSSRASLSNSRAAQSQILESLSFGGAYSVSTGKSRVPHSNFSAPPKYAEIASESIEAEQTAIAKSGRRFFCVLSASASDTSA